MVLFSDFIIDEPKVHKSIRLTLDEPKQKVYDMGWFNKKIKCVWGGGGKEFLRI
jgi:hypothetical protein